MAQDCQHKAPIDGLRSLMHLEPKYLFSERWARAQWGRSPRARFGNKPALEVTGLHRLQLFQPVVWDELLALSSGSDLDQDAAIPLAMGFSIKSSIDLEIGCTLNSGTATRNWTSNRKVSAGQWTKFNIPIAGDPLAPWGAGPGGFGLYFQIGLSCGAARLSTLDSVWNDGHYLMLESPTSAVPVYRRSDCLAYGMLVDGGARGRPRRKGASGARAAQDAALRRKELSSRGQAGNAQRAGGGLSIKASDSSAEDRVDFKVPKSIPPTGSCSKIFSPVSGAEGYAHDMSDGRDVPAQIQELACTRMLVTIPNCVPGHVYRYHWLASVFR